MIIKLKFKDQPTLELGIVDSKVGREYFNLVNQSYLEQQPIFRDRVKYTTDYMIKIAQRAKLVLGWDWVRDEYNVHTATLLHKNIEEILAGGFNSIPAEYDELLHEMHYCLHAIQGGESLNRNGWLQVEWYNDQGFALDTTFAFNDTMEFGDVKLQNPYVGHPPLTIFQEQDNVNIEQTCKFHNFVKPGINIAIQEFDRVDHCAVLSYFLQHAPNFVEQFGTDQILRYTGYPIIGKVINLDDLQIVTNSAILEFENMEFINE